MELNSNSYFMRIIFSLFSIVFLIFWIIMFLVIFATDFHIQFLVLTPLLFIPFWMFLILQDDLNRYKFTNNGIEIYKLLIFKLKKIEWKSFEFSFWTIEWGRTRSYKVIYLVKNKRLLLRISESNYSNYNDIYQCISSKIEDKGFIEINFSETIKYFTKSEINKLP